MLSTTVSFTFPLIPDLFSHSLSSLAYTLKSRSDKTPPGQTPLLRTQRCYLLCLKIERKDVFALMWYIL